MSTIFETPYYFSGVAPFFPFDEYDDTRTKWGKAKYIITEAFAEDHLRLTGDRYLPGVIPSAPTWLTEDYVHLSSSITPSPPGRIVVEELWGYTPAITHYFPGSIAWTRPGSQPFGEGTEVEVSFVSGNQIRLKNNLAETLPEGSRIVLKNRTTFSTLVPYNQQTQTTRRDAFTRPPTGQTFTRETSTSQVESGILEVVRGGTNNLQVNGDLGVLVQAGALGKLTAVIESAPGREPQSINIPCQFRRDYFTAPDIDQEQTWLPPVIQPWAIIDSVGNTTDVLTTTTNPTLAEYFRSVGQFVPGEVSRVGKVAGNVWYRETPFVRLF